MRNGLALCRLHHWAFDAGWIAFSDDHDVLVRHAPERDGYDEFKQLEGSSLNLPEDEELAPDSLFLEKQRKLSGFEDST
ncbi:restriction endonuclease-like protein [Candidatus Halobonum tyrrellensis G22]|uniref:Restriction endonuclease-like protein n=1 Tax=Candidatus Halobonum tyrrellensis G22 TaxID=1324957 RepID=V4HAK4_9EURY|nr:restriction endonuclease-like protein [Candidatus Halobonum tyrrellensis G22]